MNDDNIPLYSRNPWTFPDEEKKEEFLSLVMKHEEAHAIKEIKNLRKLYKNAINMRLGLGFFLIKEN